tara:strand:- start:1005 stop:1418 length:414 start_codon:yes stop_codon:yes gene_type:complete
MKNINFLIFHHNILYINNIYMKLINLFLGVIISIILNLMFNNILVIVNKTNKANDNMIFYLIFVIFLLSFSLYILDTKSSYYNESLKIGCIILSFWLLFNNIFLNWPNLDEKNKIIFLIIIFSIVISYSYQINKKNE